MSALIAGIFDRGWSLIADLEPDQRQLRLLRTAPGLVAFHELQLSADDAARLDLGRFEARLAFDGQARPIVFLIDPDGLGALIWPAHGKDTYWSVNS